MINLSKEFGFRVFIRCEGNRDRGIDPTRKLRESNETSKEYVVLDRIVFSVELKGPIFPLYQFK